MAAGMEYELGIDVTFNGKACRLEKY